MLVRMWGEGNHSLFVGMLIAIITMDSSMEITPKIKTRTTI